LHDQISLVSSVPFHPERAIASARPRRGFGRFLLWGAAALAFVAAWQGIERSSTPFSSVANLSINVPHLNLTRLFAPETVVVTPNSSVFAQEQAMSSTALLARWEPLVQQAAHKFNIPAQWIRAVIRQESGGRTVSADNSPITSAAGAMGVMQLMPGTYSQMAEQYGLGDDAFDPRDSIYAGAAYLNWLHRKYGYPAMFAAYNDGPGNIEDHLYHGRPLPAETRGYIASIARFLREKTIGLGNVALTQPDGVKVKIDPAKVTAIQPALPGIYAASVHAVINMGKIRRGVRETAAEATALLRAHGAAI
jgi:membrane-bound lytic murein transglycosylase B